MAHWHEGPVCAGCYYQALAAKDTCPSCGHHRRLRHYPGFEISVCADCAGQPATHVCQRCGIEDCLYDRGLCPRCALEKRLVVILGDSEARSRTGLGRLFDALVASADPKAAIDWLNKTPRAVDALTRIGRGDLPLSYETIDALEPALGTLTARHLENLLGSTGALPGRDPVLAATERWCERFLGAIDHHEHAKLLRTWVRWRLLRPLRDKASNGPLLDSTGHSVRYRLKSVSDFCEFLVGRARSVATCRQADLDFWVASGPPTRVRPLSAFASWAIKHKAMPALEVHPRHSDLAAPPMSSDERWGLARRLLHEPGLKPAVRLGGALAVVYAQPLYKISRLRIEDLQVTADRVVVRIGGGIELPEPLAGHARDLIATRPPTPRKVALPTDPGWLFPGNVPGRPITTQAFSDQLARHGVRAERHRLTALFQLASEIPAPLLADILGISRATAEVWSRLANRTWADYPEMRSADA